MQVIGVNTTQQDVWKSNVSNNVFRIDGMTSLEWAAKTGGQLTEFWEQRDALLASNFTKIWGNSMPAQFPLDGLFHMSVSGSEREVAQVISSMPQWTRFGEIRNNGGTAFGIDLETFGNVLSGTDKTTFGITEAAIGTRVYDGLGNIERAGHSFIIGIDEAQGKYLTSIVDKFKIVGRTGLSNDEIVALERMSMYAPSTAIMEQHIDDFGLSGRLFKVAGELGAPTLDTKYIKAGIANLRAAYNAGATPEKVLPIITEQLIKYGSASDAILYGANSMKFDIPALNNALRSWNITLGKTSTSSLVESVSALSDDFLDVIYAARALSDANSESVGTYLFNTFGLRADGSVEGLLKAMRAQTTQKHQGALDLINEGTVLDEMVEAVLGSEREIKDAMKGHTVGNSIFLIHTGTLNHENAQEMAIVGGKPVASYSITNEYWKINADHTGYIDLDGSKKFVLALDNYADISAGRDVTSFIKIYDSQEEGLQDLIKRSSVFTNESAKHAQVTGPQAITQQEFKYKDFGRREFHKMFSPTDIRTEHGRDVYGFESLKRNMELLTRMEKDGVTLDMSPSSIENFMEYVRTTFEPSHPLHNAYKGQGKSYYQAQAFIGMYDKLKNEEELLKAIVDKVDIVDASNIDKTIAARNAYMQAIQYMDDTYGRKNAKTAKSIMSDALGFDVRIPDGQIKRVNIYNTRTATNDLTRIFSGLDGGQLVDVIDEIYSNPIFDEASTAYHQIRMNALHASTNKERHMIAQDIAYDLYGNFSVNALNTTNSVINNARKSFDGTMQSIADNVETDRIIRFNRPRGNTALAFGDAYGQVSEAIGGIIDRAIIDMPNTTYVDILNSGPADLKRQLDIIADNLNIRGDDERKLLLEMFTHSDRYGIKNYHKQGLRAFIAQQDPSSSAFVFLTREQDANRFYEKLVGGEFALTSRGALVDSGINEYASFIEIPKINEYQLGDGNVLRAINQSRTEDTVFEKYIVPELRVRYHGNKIDAYFNNGEYDFLSTPRIGLQRSIESVLEGEYETGTKIVRKKQNAYLSDLSASSSYRGYIVEGPNGEKIVKRIASLGPSDFIQSGEQRLSEGLYELFKASVVMDADPTNLNVAQQIVSNFGHIVGAEMTPRYKNNMQKYLSDIVNGMEFREFFTKRLYTGAVSSDSFGLTGAAFDKNLFQIIQDLVESNPHGIYAPTVKEALSKIPMEHIYPVLSESAVAKGIVSSISPGEYNDAASLHSAMRPTFTQQNNGIYYSLDDIDLDKLAGIENSVFFDDAVIASKEYHNRAEITLNGEPYRPVDGIDYTRQRRSMVARIKQMGDYDLQIRYSELRANSALNAASLGLDEDTYLKALSYMEQDMMSLHEGKMFIAPGLSEQSVFQARDSKRITLNLDNVDIAQTEKKLKGLIGKEIDRNTVVGVSKSGAPVYLNIPETVLTAENVRDLLNPDLQETRVIPKIGDIIDTKLMINGSEKGTAHSIAVSKFMKYTGITDDSLALRVANGLFGQVSDGASVIANLAVEKHGNMFAVHSIWNAIVSTYKQNGQTKMLFDALNYEVAHNVAFRGVNPFELVDGELLSSNTFADNFAYAIQSFYKKIQSNEILDSKINAQVLRLLEDLDETNSIYGILQRQAMNEHMGTQLTIDQRIEQSIRTRGMKEGGAGPERIDDAFADVLKGRSIRYDGSGTGLKKKFGALQQYLDVYEQGKNGLRGQNAAIREEAQRSVKGLVESVNFFGNPYDVAASDDNIIRISINDLLDKDKRFVVGGKVTDDLYDSLFLVNGKPSNHLQRLIDEQNIDISRAHSLYLDLGQTEFSIGKNKYRGLMIPMQSITGSFSEKPFYQDQQRAVKSLLSRVVQVTSNPKDLSLAASISGIYSSFIEEASKNLRFLKKDADIYKAYQEYAMPTSMQLLGQDESAPLVREMMGKDLSDLIAKKKDLEKSLSIAYNAEDAKALQSVYDDIGTQLEEIGRNIRENDEYYSDFVSVRGKLKEASKVVVDGKTHYGMAVAISEEGFEKLGFDFGAIGMDVFADVETGAGRLERITDFEGRIVSSRAEIAGKLNALGIDDLVIDDSQPIMQQLNTFVKGKYGLDRYSISIADVNKAIIQNKEVSSIVDVFSDIGKDYASEVGTYGLFIRYPIMRSQPTVRIVLDKGLVGSQIRSLNPILSSLSNLDFDGDAPFLAAITDGASFVGVKDKAFKLSDKSYKDFAVKDSRNLLAELIESGDVFKVDPINNVARQSAAMLEKFKSDVFEDAIAQWARENGIEGKLTDAQKYAARSSQTMIDAFNSIKFNTITDEDSIIASMAARFRKESIGYISTPNYTIRDALLTAMRDPAYADKAVLLNNTYVSLSNMSSKAGGFFSLAEQKSIDVKHVSDGMDIAHTARYSMGMSKLFVEKPTVQSNFEAIYDILSATNSGIFKTTDKDLQLAANLIVNSRSITDLRDMLITAGIDSDAVPYYTALRQLLSIQEEIPDFYKIYKSSLARGSLDKTIAEQIAELGAKDFDELSKKYYGTALGNVIGALSNSYSGTKPSYTVNNLYVNVGRIEGNSYDTYYIYKGAGKFQEVDPITAKISKHTTKHPGTIHALGTNIGDGTGISYLDFKQGVSKRAAEKSARVFKTQTLLDDVLIGKKNTVLDRIPESFIKMGNSKSKKGLSTFGEGIWHDVNRLFISNTRKTPEIYASINTLTNALNYAIKEKSISGATSAVDLIRQINQDIAKNPEEYARRGLEYDTILHDRLISESLFGSEEQLTRAIERARDGIDIDKYDEYLDFFNKEIYDIMEQEKILAGSFASVDAEISGLQKQGISEEILKPLKDVQSGSAKETSDIISGLRSSNDILMRETQDKVYTLFRNTSQMDKFFEWDKRSGQSIVGFGEFLGKHFQDLTTSDIQYIQDTAASFVPRNALEEHAKTQTLEALGHYRTIKKSGTSLVGKTSEEVTRITQRNLATINDTLDKAATEVTNKMKKLMDEASKMTKKTLTSEVTSSVKKVANSIPKKTVGVVIGAMAALGIANNILHREKSQSPLTPARRSGSEQSNSYENVPSQAPMSKKNVVYHDNTSGFNFKVSAQTKHQLSDRDNAKLVNNSGGGNTSVYTQTDMSTVTDNWLANKFAELS